MSTAEDIIITGLTKRFGATTALDRASTRIRRGSVHAVLGENGAGKSTLIKILSGVIKPDEGEVRLGGKRLDLGSPVAAHRAGIATAFQELSLVPDLSVAENLAMPNPTTRWGLMNRRGLAREAEALLARYGIFDVDVGATVRSLDLSVRQKLEIVHAMARQPHLLLLDEPTSALASRDVEWLGLQIEARRQAGCTVVMITHRMPEVREFCEEMSILRNGRFVGLHRTQDIDDETVFKEIMGRSMDTAYPPRLPVTARPAKQPPRLQGTGLCSGERLKGVSFDLHPAECVGVVALQGMGQLELFYSLFGLTPLDAGTVAVDGVAVTIGSPGKAISQGIGLGLVPEERKTEGLALNLSGGENVSLPVIGRFARWGLIDLAREREAVLRALEQVRGNPRALTEPAQAFSGGNQQKLVMAKWLLADTRALLLFDPTRGVDVGAKHEIYELMRNYTAAGGAILMYSTEIPEVINLCDRILVMYAGRVVAELDGAGCTEAGVTTAMLSVAAAAPAAQGVAT